TQVRLRQQVFEERGVLAAGPMLQACLVTEARHGGRGDAVDDWRRLRKEREIGQGADASCFQASHLVVAHPGYLAQVVRIHAQGGAVGVPATYAAVRDRRRDGSQRKRYCRAARDLRLESVPYAPEIGEVVVEPMTVDPVAAAPECDVHQRWHAALDGGQQVRVDAHLQERAALGAACQLGVNHLVVVLTQGALAINPPQEVDVSKPGAIEERGLVDDVRPLVHELEGSGSVALDVFKPASPVTRVRCEPAVYDLVAKLPQVGKE